MIVLCMDPEDRERWDRLNWQSRSSRAALPCGDCTPEFASQMMAVYRCNGFPGMRYPPRVTSTPNRRVHRYEPEERQERRRASWRAYRARIRARKL